MKKYNPAEIETKWQKIWEEKGAFKAKDFDKKPKFYQLEMFPYPSGRIHMGHVRNYSIGDAIARYKFAQGYNVLHPMGFDAFGMPAENAAINNKTHPAKWTYSNIDYMIKELKRLGFSYDWDRLVITCDENYYKWEQKIFIEMLKKGMVYRAKSTVNYCPTCKTVLANEQVEDGKCWRCGDEVIQKEMDEWFLKITDYADQLLDDMELIKDGWPEKVLIQQKNWIGKSKGAFVKFKIKGRDEYLEVFTTRPDTLFGVTFVSIAPNHPKLMDLVSDEQVSVVEAFVEEFKKVDRDFSKEKEGVFTGAYLINPATGEEVPLYAANFVLMDYGTGVVMAVPAHDQRDFEFATKYGLKKKIVITTDGLTNNPDELDKAYTEVGVLVNSGQFDGMDNEKAKWEIVKWLEDKGLARVGYQYRLRDWNVSRQRYWGAPIPVVYCPNCGIVPEKEENLPVRLPENVEITGEGGSPLAKVDEFVNTKCPVCGADAKRETDTFDTFVESSWYFLRYCSPKYDKAIFDKQRADYWMDVDQYVGGIEHAVMHLLYARYFTKVLRDLGYANSTEPFKRLLTQGMVIKDGAKMSKSKGNVVDPDDIINQYGADTARLFILFAAPPEKDLEWSDEGVEGAYRFLNRVWRLVYEYKDLKVIDIDINTDRLKELNYMIHSTIKKITQDFENYHFNTAIAASMEFVNFLYDFKPKTEDENALFAKAIEVLLIMLNPIVPHIAEELWQLTGHETLIAFEPWPEYDESATVKDTVTIAITVNGKLRDTLSLPRGIAEDEVFNKAKESEKIRRHIDGKTIIKKIFVKDKLLNIVVK
ncbi:leucyl-tRNA synthetase [Hippea maritima DSM 10411]|uniref:Leucine--tRNA ligase n=1 Tax=Hippea maritima (strain ATCC 700847 / DSM 10411 / MH2) TaxID=760142 RepID=F2LWM0_HIPMA|nr:leucyl-tRNA synthetase [Hippea maritima DSM 10411]